MFLGNVGNKCWVCISGENAPTLTTANLKAFVNKQMKSEKEASWTNMEGAQSVVHRGAGKKRKIA